jgi:hypothetical protein
MFEDGDLDVVEMMECGQAMGVTQVRVPASGVRLGTRVG